MKNSNLTDLGAIPIIKSLKHDIIILDLSLNPKISIHAYEILFEVIDSKL